MPESSKFKAMGLLFRPIGVLLLLIGVALAVNLALHWHVSLYPPPSLCGCEYDAAIKHWSVLSFITATCIATMAVIAGAALIIKRPSALLILSMLCVLVAAAPWIHKMLPLTFPAGVDGSEPPAYVVTLVAIALAFICMVGNGSYRRFVVAAQKTGKTS